MSFPAENCKPSFRAPVSLNSKPLTQPSFTEQKNPYTSFPAENGMCIYMPMCMIEQEFFLIVAAV